MACWQCLSSLVTPEVLLLLAVRMNIDRKIACRSSDLVKRLEMLF
jgi:hypothetical protein